MVQETEVADQQEIEDVASQEIEAVAARGTEDASSRETEVEVLVPWDPWGVPDGREDPWVCFRMGYTDRDPVDYSQTDPEVFRQVQAGVEDHPEDPWACCLVGTLDQDHVGCSPRGLEACPDD